MSISCWKDWFESISGEQWHSLLFWSFWVHLALYPIGYGFREVLSGVNILFLLCYYRKNWNESVLKNLSLLPLFACLWVMILLGVVLSTDPMSSLLQASKNLNKGYVLPFVAMECVRDFKDLKWLVYALVISLFWEGIDGIWQYCTGHDFIMGYPIKAGRLTGSLASYWVGNYVSLVLVPASGLWFILRNYTSFVKTSALYILLFFPGYFLLIAAQARAGFISLVAIALLWFFLFHEKKHFYASLSVLVLSCIGLVLSLAMRGGLQRVLSDGRWSLWELAWKVFEEFPFFGAGIWQYNSAFRRLGLVPTNDAITITHPHNIYLDLLCSHGLIGTALGLSFLFGMVVWGMRHILPQIRKGASLYWKLTTLFFMGYLGWLVQGFVGHDFYRIWWFSLAMIFLGISIGAVSRGLEEEKKKGTQMRA